MVSQEPCEGKPEAHQRIRGSLHLGSGELRVENFYLVARAALALQEGALPFAARLLGAVQSALTARGLVLHTLASFLHAQTLARVEAALDRTGFEATWEERSRWSPAKATGRALAEDA